MQHWTWKWCPNSPNLWSVCPNICQKMWALFEREIFIQTWMLRAACTHMWGNREYWSAAGSAGFGDLSFFFQVFGQEHEIELMPRWLFWRTGLGKDGRKERNHFLWNTICSESSKPTRLSTYQLVSFNLCYLSPLIGEWKYFHRVSSTIMSSSTHNNILGVTLSGDFGDVCTLSDLRPNRSWAIPHNCLIIFSAHNIDRAEAAAAIPSLAMSWPSLQFGSIRGQHLQAVSYMLS